MTDKIWAYDVSLDRFAWCWQARSSEETRYYLQGVWIEPREQGGVYMVGTDGHIMAVAIDEEGVCAEPAIIEIGRDLRWIIEPVTEHDPETDEPFTQWRLPEATRLRFDALEPDTSVVAEAWHSGWHGSFGDCGVVRRLKGTYPDWRRATRIGKKKQVSGPVGMTNPRLLNRLAYRGNAVQMLHRFGITADPRDGVKTPGAVVLCYKAPWACGFIMPVHCNGWEKWGDLARELLDDQEPPLKLAVWS